MRCKFCGLAKLKSITNTHLKQHNLSMKQYKKIFPNQKIFSKKHLTAHEVKKHILSKDEISVLYGSLFGDGCITKGNTRDFLYSEGHKLEHADYLHWKANYFNKIGGAFAKVRFFDKRTNKFYERLQFRSRTSKTLTSIRSLFYLNGKKYISLSNLNKLDLLGLVVWCCDDGCYQYANSSFSIATNCFYLKDLELLQKWFYEKYGLETKLYKNCGDFNIYFNSKSTKKLMDLIFPIVDKIPACMHYKFGRDEMRRVTHKENNRIRCHKYFEQHREENRIRARDYYWQHKEINRPILVEVKT